ncbi:carboxypeptidase-like regulatory domain-containing protein [Flaviaesturariibacter amylovorans]|uniref:T9SS type A sorting domain-containing protein n=1 Tax=Flaviaesturariibacter amylovorans TaxID=1084520 RepID=A0ABP8HTD8_9BACT
MPRTIQLQLPSPCSESWDGMTPDGSGRFCASCQKTVTDFTAMSDAAIAAYLAQQSGPVCGRLYPDQLNRPMAVPRKPFPGLRHLVTVLLPAFLLSLKSTAQNNGNRVAAAQSPRPSKTPAAAPITVTGTVRDERGAPVPSATVQAGRGTVVSADAEGRFSLTVAAGATIRVTSVGFQETSVSAVSGDPLEVVLQPAAGELNEVVVQSYGQRRVGQLIMGGISSVGVRTLAPEGTTRTGFKAFPNPVISGNILNIRPEGLEPGNYDLQLITMSGQLVHRGSAAYGGKGAAPMPLPLPGVLAGNYLLRVVHQRSGKAFTEQLVVRY